MDPFAIDVIGILGIIFYFVVSIIMAYAYIIDVGYKGDSWVDCMFANICVFLFGFMVWPISVVVIYSTKLYRLFVKEIKHPWYP